MADRQHFSVGAEKTRTSGGGGLRGRSPARRVWPNDQFPQHAIDTDGYTLCQSERWPAAATFRDLDWEDAAVHARCPDCSSEYRRING